MTPKNKTGRPARNEEPATKRISVPVTSKEKEDFDNRAKQQGKDSATLARELILPKAKDDE